MMPNELKKIRRTCWDALVAELSRPQISILLGPRQVGKTHLLKELQNYCEGTLHRPTLYYNLEIPSDLIAFQKSDLELFEMLTQSEYTIVFIDEFHYLPNASKLFKAIYDSEKNIKIVVSGSSSIEIHKHLKESLAGRRSITRITPLTFEEICSGFPDRDRDILFEEYVTYGGLPGLISIPDPAIKIKYLQDILETYIQKDIKSLIKEENIRAFNVLMYLLAENQGQVVSVNSLAREIGLTPRSIERYLDILEQTYVLYSLHSYSRNIGNELKKSRKFYLYDLGLRNAILKDFRFENRDDLGTIFESFIHNQWHARLHPNQELKFWRDRHGLEIDFVFLENRVPTIVEVKSKSSEIPKAFTHFIAHYPDTIQGIVYVAQPTTLGVSQNEKIEFRHIHHISVPK